MFSLRQDVVTNRHVQTVKANISSLVAAEHLVLSTRPVSLYLSQRTHMRKMMGSFSIWRRKKFEGEMLQDQLF